MPRSRTIVITAVAGTLIAGAAGAGAYAVLHTRGTPQEAARTFATAWQRGDTAAMRAAVATPPADLAEHYTRLNKALGVKQTTVVVGATRETGDNKATADFTVTFTLKSVGAWSYQGRLPLKVHERHWRVDWTPAAVHPDLTADRRLAISTSWPDRAEITAANGRRIDGSDVPGSVQQLVGAVGAATEKDVERLGSAYRPGDKVGVSGLQYTLEERLAGTPNTEIRVVDSAKKALKTLTTMNGQPGTAVRTTLDLGIQDAAAKAVKGREKPTSLVAIKPSTGEILAVANNVGGFNRALMGRYAPGSTFKTVTAAALLKAGVKPEQIVNCPQYATVGGLKIRNSEHAQFGSLPFADAFAFSCNTTFAPLAKERLSGGKLGEMAEMLGFGKPLTPGAAAIRPSFPKPTSDAELAAAAFGQAKVTANPLSMAAVAAAVADGTWRPPTLVEGLRQEATPVELPGTVVRALRPMMRSVVTKGTGKAAGLPDGTAGKTGTAEFGTGEKLESHAWFHGFKGDLAFAVIVEGGGGGGKVAAPVAAQFLRAL